MPTVFLTFGLLSAAILALWFRASFHHRIARHAWWALLVASAAGGISTGIVDARGAAWLALFAAAAAVSARDSNRRTLRWLATAMVVILAAGLLSHQLPGFNNPVVIPPTRLTPDAIPYRLHFNFDKTAAGLLLLALCCSGLAASGAAWRRLLRRAAPVAAGLLFSVMLASLAAGYVRFEPKFPRESALWVWANLCFTCLAEEAVFRGFIQARLARAWAAMRHGEWLALLAAAGLFGLAHYGGGWVYVALATLAGVGYGWAYLRTRAIEASILTHFTLNAVHFFAFTYPALRPPPAGTTLASAF